jgi:tRNA threonylcarbamoyl adenosine modification protein YeaZ
MPLILAINTASKENGIALLTGERVLEEATWISESNDSLKVLPEVVKLLDQAGKGWKDLTHVFVVKGPGGYTRLRVGITIANTLAWLLKIPLLTTDIFEVWEHRIVLEDRSEPHETVIEAGRGRTLRKGDKAPQPWEEIEAGKRTCYGEMPTESALRKEVAHSLGQAILEIFQQGMEPVDQVEPLYTQPPNITLAKKVQRQSP